MSYPQLAETEWQVVAAGIHAEMTRRGFTGSPESGYALAGKFVEPLGPEGGDIGGRMREGVAGGPETRDAAVDPREEVYRWWVDSVPGVFGPWRSLPDPVLLDPAVAQLGRAADTLACQATLNDTGLTGGNPTLQVELTTAITELAHFNGAAVDAFSHRYLNRLPHLLGAQFAATGLGVVLLVAQQECWRRSRDDVAAIAAATLGAVRATTPGAGGGTDVEVVIAVAGALVGAAATVASGGAALPLSLGLASSALGVLGALWPAGEDPAVRASVAAGDPREALDRAAVALGTVDRHVTLADEEIRSRADRARAVVEARPGDFDLTAPALTESTDVDDLLRPTEIAEDLETLRRIGLSHLPAIAREMLRSTVTADPALGVLGWQRPGHVGVGGVGAHGAWSSLLHALARTQTEARAELEAAGEHLAIAADLMGSTEEQVERELRRHAGEVRRTRLR